MFPARHENTIINETIQNKTKIKKVFIYS